MNMRETLHNQKQYPSVKISGSEEIRKETNERRR
jgi:hypothetical protein